MSGHVADRTGPNIISAAYHGRQAEVRAFLDAGIHPDSTLPGINDTALLAAAGTGQIEVVKLLLERGADINFKRPFYGSALNCAALHYQLPMVGYLLGKGCKNDLSLDAAAIVGDLQRVSELLESGVDPNRSCVGVTPLALARAGGHSAVAKLIEDAGGHPGGPWNCLKQLFRSLTAGNHRQAPKP